MEHAELIEGAFVNYLSDAANATWPASFDVGRIFPGENNLDKDGQRIVCYLEGGDLGEEDPPLSGNRMTTVTVQLRTPFSKLTAAQKAAGQPEPLDGHKAVADALQSAITAANDENLTAAITGWTCFGLADCSPFREQEDNAWVSGWKLKIYSCPSSFSN